MPNALRNKTLGVVLAVCFALGLSGRFLEPWFPFRIRIIVGPAVIALLIFVAAWRAWRQQPRA
jgi:hypothetical protein